MSTYEEAQAHVQADIEQLAKDNPTAESLLRECAQQFRFYERQHRAKLDDPSLLPHSRELTAQKADANAEFADRIDKFLSSELPDNLAT